MLLMLGTSGVLGAGSLKHVKASTMFLVLSLNVHASTHGLWDLVCKQQFYA